MTTKIVFESDVAEFIANAIVLNRDLVNEGIKKAGFDIRDAVASELRTTERTHFKTSLLEHKHAGKIRTIVASSHRTFNEFGARFSHKDKLSRENPDSMAKMAKTYLDEDNHLAVVLGRFKTFRTVEYENGVRKGAIGKKITGTAKGSNRGTEKDIFNIMRKLNDGGTHEVSGKERKLLENMYIELSDGRLVKRKFLLGKGTGHENITRVTYKKTNFAEKGFQKSKSIAERKVVSNFEKHFDNVMKEADKGK